MLFNFTKQWGSDVTSGHRDDMSHMTRALPCEQLNEKSKAKQITAQLKLTVIQTSSRVFKCSN